MFAADRAAHLPDVGVKLSARAAILCTSSSLAKSKKGRMCNWPWPAWPKSEAVTCSCLRFCARCKKSGSASGGTAMSSTIGTGAWSPSSGRASARSAGQAATACRDRTSRQPRRHPRPACVSPAQFDGPCELLLDFSGTRRDAPPAAPLRPLGESATRSGDRSLGPGSDAGGPSSRKHSVRAAGVPARRGPPFRAIRKTSSTLPTCLGSGEVVTVTSVISPSVPSLPAKSRARLSMPSCETSSSR